MNVEFESSENETSDEDGEIIPDLGPNAEENDEKVYDCNTEMGSFIPTKVNSRKEKDVLNDSVLKSKTIKICKDALNEFTTEYLVAVAFPTLLPDGKRDRTKFSTRRLIWKSDIESFSEKIKHLIKFAEFINNKWTYRFGAHPRFGFWVIVRVENFVKHWLYNILLKQNGIGIDLNML